jgi:hypothetical protein
VGRPTTEDAALIDARRAEALRLRAGGLSLYEVGQRLHETVWQGERGYACDRDNYSQLTAAVAKDVAAAIAKQRRETNDLARVLADVHEERLETLWQHAEQLLETSPEAAITLALRVLERHARLRGLDAAARVQLSGPGDEAVSDAYRELVRAAAGEGGSAETER